jgi:ABC-type branched-subunit amino acid transport system substrate-binding protein
MPAKALRPMTEVCGMATSIPSARNAPFSRRRRCAVLAVGLCSLALAIAPSDGLSRVEGDRIILGATISLTGKYSGSGKHTKNGYDLAVAAINKAGGVKVGGRSYRLELKYYDDGSETKLSTELAERLIAEDRIRFMLGPYSSALTAAAARVVEKHKVPMIEANGASRSIFSRGYRYVFGVLSTSEQYLSSVVDLVADLEKKVGRSPKELSLAIVVEEDPFSLDVRAGVVERAEALGVEVVADERFPPDFTDSTEIFKRVADHKPTILIVPQRADLLAHLSEDLQGVPDDGLPGRRGRGRGDRLEGRLRAGQQLRYRGSAKRHRGHQPEDLLRQHQVRPDWPERGQAHGPAADPAGKVQGGRAGRVGVLAARLPAQGAAMRRVGPISAGPRSPAIPPPRRRRAATL